MLSKIRAFGQGLIPRSKGAGFILLILLMALVGMAGVASAAGVIPEMDLITSYSSTGGTPQFKDNNQDLIYKIQQGDTIIFSITPTSTPETIYYLWQVMQGSQVVASSTEGTTFNWTVPSATSTWEIEIEATLKDEVGNTKGRESISWSITISDIKTVNPGGSIQAAIDALPTEGGIVELKEGTWDITSPIRIRNSNTTLRGQGIDKTIINQATTELTGIVVGKWDDPAARESWLGSKDIRHNKYLIRIRDYPEEFVQNVRIEKMTINRKGSQTYQIGTAQAINLGISEIKSDGNVLTGAYIVGVYVAYSIDVTVRDCVLYRYGYPLRYFSANYRLNTIDNTLSETTGWNSIEYNGIWSVGKDWEPGLTGEEYLRPSGPLVLGSNGGDTRDAQELGLIGSVIRGNKIYNGGQIIYIYSSWDVLATENYIDGTTTTPEGPIHCRSNSAGIVVSKNIIMNSRVCGIGVWHGLAHTRAEIFGNIIYNTKFAYTGAGGGHGITVMIGGYDYGRVGDIKIYSNTIVGNEGDGIWDEAKDRPVIAKNNIIVNNKGAGIRNVDNSNISYNDVWGNAGGNYIDCSAGTGDISADPLLADSANGDFHLKSQYGRWNGTTWVLDSVTSPALDAGDPADDYSNEPQPNGGRINMGAYGNTAEASKSGVSTIDINQDGTIDISDLRLVALHFGETTTSPYPRYDVNTDGTIDILDLRQVAGGM